MNERPTPEEIQQLIEDLHDGGYTSEATIDEYMDALAAHGYVLVHPDDVPVRDTSGLNAYPEEDMLRQGWNACRDAILGAGVREGTG